MSLKGDVLQIGIRRSRSDRVGKERKVSDHSLTCCFCFELGWLKERQRASPFKFKVVDIYIYEMNDINLVLKVVKLLYNIHCLLKIHNKI